METEANSLVRELGEGTKCDAPVHCECALIQHYSEAVRSAKSVAVSLVRKIPEELYEEFINHAQ